jgi:hypothetical protein
MAFDAILDEVEQLYGISSRLKGLAEKHPTVLDAMLTLAESVRGAATILAVLVSTKLQRLDDHGSHSSPSV